MPGHHTRRVAPFGFARLLARMQLPLHVSPVSASFFGLQRLGILLVLSLACRSPHSPRTPRCAWRAWRLPLSIFVTRRSSHTTIFSSALGKIEVIMLFSF